MGIVIPFEAVRQDRPETEEEKRIKEKEAIYRGLIEQEAWKYGVTFEEEFALFEQEEQELHEEDPEVREVVAKRTGVGLYEASLDINIGFLKALNKYAPDYRDPARLTNG